MPNDLRDRLRSIREAIQEQTARRADLVRERDSAKEAFASNGVAVAELTDTPEFAAAQEAVRSLGEVDDSLGDLRNAEVVTLELLGESQRTPSNGAQPANGVPPVEGWNVDSVLKGETYRRFVEAGMPSTKAKIGSQMWGQLADRDSTAKFLRGMSAASHEVGTADVASAIPADFRGVMPPVLRRLTLLDIFPTGTTDSNVVEYVQVNTIPSSAGMVAEGDLKPGQSFDTTDADAPVRTIAGWIKVRKQALADYAGLRTMLGTLLPYDVRRVIEAQMLNGDGTGQNLLGIIQQPGIGNPSAVTGDNNADAILRAMTTVILSDADPNFVAVHPLVWQNLLLMREDNAARTGQYLYGAPNVPQAPTIWGLAITASRIVPTTDSVVGDSAGATLLVREGVNVLVSDSDQDDFIRNRATLLAEARVAFPVWRPTSFALANTVG